MSRQDHDEPFNDELRSLVTAGNRIEAVKQYREHMGCGLQAAFAAVDDLARQQGISQRETDSVEWDVTSLLEAGQKLQAIKFYRQRMGSSLEEAKQFVEQIGTEHRIPGAQGSGCFGVMVLAILLLFRIAMAIE